MEDMAVPTSKMAELVGYIQDLANEHDDLEIFTAGHAGEHAVGMLKSQWNNVELGENVVWVQHQIKSLFDPMNLLNPKCKID
ncbi:hypothetical protein FC52_GL001696 [Lactobacillus pasteurii DSM 23907 = CRBIP 24.76]|nr:hypothetical protein FC52_GL001696 [Lactobacillus pasteurii DSM 23907 = CRBIP 24.76]TDG78108.1 hypothetical protein C5L33_000171 [Lactobacillus pasteurii]